MGSFSYLEPVCFSMSSSNCCFLTCIQVSQEAGQFSQEAGIPLELFQILKDDAVEVLHSICQQTWKTHQWPQEWKRSVFIPITKKFIAKVCSNYLTIALILLASKVIFKILQARSQHQNQELLVVQAGFQTCRGTRYDIANIHCIMEKASEFQKRIYFCFIDYVLTVWITTNCGKFLKIWEYRPPYLFHKKPE